PFGVRGGDLIVKDVPRHVVADGRSRYDRWQLARADARAAGATPSLVVLTVGDCAREDRRPAEKAAIPDVAVVTVSGSERVGAHRPGGSAFGALVHGILAQVPFDASVRDVAGIAAVEARLLGLSDAAADAAAAIVEGVV